jgi:hypothetical protein
MSRVDSVASPRVATDGTAVHVDPAPWAEARAADAEAPVVIAGVAARGASVERLVRFGDAGQGLGVLGGPPDRASGLVLLLPSAGLQPRSGPFRLHVALAERLAADGIRTFRFDVPGVGETPRDANFDARAAAIAAIDTLEREHGATSFAIGGVCSAADLGWATAVSDARVRGLLSLDGIAFRGRWYSFARTVDRIRRIPGEWRRMLRDARKRPAGGVESLDSADFRDWPTLDEARAQFAQLTGREVSMLWIYTGGYTDRFLHARQFRSMFGAVATRHRVAMHYWPDCDHTFYARSHRERLIERIAEWARALRDETGAGA